MLTKVKINKCPTATNCEKFDLNLNILTQHLRVGKLITGKSRESQWAAWNQRISKNRQAGGTDLL